MKVENNGVVQNDIIQSIVSIPGKSQLKKIMEYLIKEDQLKMYSWQSDTIDGTLPLIESEGEGLRGESWCSQFDVTVKGVYFRISYGNKENGGLYIRAERHWSALTLARHRKEAKKWKKKRKTRERMIAARARK